MITSLPPLFSIILKIKNSSFKTGNFRPIVSNDDKKSAFSRMHSHFGKMPDLKAESSEMLTPSDWVFYWWRHNYVITWFAPFQVTWPLWMGQLTFYIIEKGNKCGSRWHNTGYEWNSERNSCWIWTNSSEKSRWSWRMVQGEIIY